VTAEKQSLLAGLLIVDAMASSILPADFQIKQQESAINN
jgi:hypothetical protein